MSDSERPEQRPSLSPEEVQPIETPDSAPPVVIVDTTPGGAKENDPLWQGLEKAAADGDEAYLNVFLRTFAEVGDSGEISLTPDMSDSVTVNVDAEQVTAHESGFYQVTGTFEVEQLGDAAFTLSTVDGEEITELNPQGPDAEARCTADDAQDRIELAASDLADDPELREDMRLQWGAAPEVWWGIQQTALSLRGSDEEFAGDFLAEVCGPYRDGAPDGGEGDAGDGGAGEESGDDSGGGELGG
nr:hypothetical protein GCM10023233_23190 [Brevibacterium otitidis]